MIVTISDKELMGMIAAMGANIATLNVVVRENCEIDAESHAALKGTLDAMTGRMDKMMKGVFNG